MLAAGQVEHFKSFGFLHSQQFYSEREIADISAAADASWERLRGGRPLDPEQGQGENAFVERDPTLTRLVVTDRLLGAVESILGPGYLWSGSEGNVTVNTEHPWHPDRPGDHDEVSYTRMKINLYLDTITEETGCLRVIPSSHRMPLHREIEPDSMHQRQGLAVRPYGVSGQGMPSVSLLSNPGDAVFFHQSLWHAIFNGWAGRRYIALKFAAKPTTDNHIASLRYYTGGIFDPHPRWRESGDARIQAMVGDLPRLGAQKTHEFAPFRDDSPNKMN